jgi:hypothetical protein
MFIHMIYDLCCLRYLFFFYPISHPSSFISDYASTPCAFSVWASSTTALTDAISTISSTSHGGSSKQKVGTMEDEGREGGRMNEERRREEEEVKDGEGEGEKRTNREKDPIQY